MAIKALRFCFYFNMLDRSLSFPSAFVAIVTCHSVMVTSYIMISVIFAWNCDFSCIHDGINKCGNSLPLMHVTINKKGPNWSSHGIMF